MITERRSKLKTARLDVFKASIGRDQVTGRCDRIIVRRLSFRSVSERGMAHEKLSNGVKSTEDIKYELLLSCLRFGCTIERRLVPKLGLRMDNHLSILIV